MAYGNPSSNPGGDEDNYSDGPDAMTKQASESNSAHADETPKGNEDEPTGLLPKSILAGKDFQPGDEIVLKINRIMDDQVEVSYAPEKGGEDKGGEEKAEMPEGGGDAEMAGMME